MDKLVAIRIKHNDGTYSNEIPLSVLAINIDWDGTHSLVDVLGNVDLNKGSIQEQINALITTITPDNVQWDLTHTLSDVLGDVDLDKGDLQTQIDNISDGEIQVDSTLAAAGKAADAKAVGDNLKNVVRVGNSNVTNFTSIILGDTAEQVNLLDQSDLININTRLSALENGGIQVDQTLSVEGMAADAKATGDAIHNLQGLVGTPLVAATAASMTDTNKIYVYTGSETGYTNGNWYYYDGTTWVSGGVYNSIAMNMDSLPTLGSSNPVTSGGIKAALDLMDEDISSLNEDITNLQDRIHNEFESIGVVTKVSPNLLNPDEVETGRITSSSSTVLHTGNYDDMYVTTGFIPVEEGTKYAFFFNRYDKICNPGVANIWGYNSNKTGVTYLGSITYDDTGSSYITVPSGCVYVRASITTAIYTSFGTIMFLEVDGIEIPSEIYEYGTQYELSGYADEQSVNKINSDLADLQAAIDNNFIPEWGAVEGSVTQGKMIESNGSIADTAANYAIRTITVSPNKQYKVSAKAYNNKYYYAFYDDKGEFVSGLKSSNSGTTSIIDELAVAPSNATNLVACGSKSENNVIIKEIIGYAIKDKYPWYGKKWTVVGDSITQINEATTKHYFDYIAERSGVTPYNMGVGGTGYCRGYDNNKAFYQRISSVPTDSDIVTIFGSGNDMNIEVMSKFDNLSWQQALGTYTDTTADTICGCVNLTLDNYFEVMPVVPIGIIAPAPWKSYPTTKLTNNRFADYVEALKQICEYRGVPFLDLYHGSNLRPENEDNCDTCYYSGSSLDGNGDGVHPNELGHMIIAPKIYEFIKTLLIG